MIILKIIIVLGCLLIGFLLWWAIYTKIQDHKWWNKTPQERAAERKEWNDTMDSWLKDMEHPT